MRYSIEGIEGLPEIGAGADLAALITAALPTPLEDGDILVITSKVVSKAEGRVVRADDRDTGVDRDVDLPQVLRGQHVPDRHAAGQREHGLLISGVQRDQHEAAHAGQDEQHPEQQVRHAAAAPCGAQP